MNVPAGADRVGLAFAAAAYLQWGLYPFYFKALQDIAAFEIVAHRVLWSLVLLACLLPFGGGWRMALEALRDRRRLAGLAVTTLLISVNWVVYVAAVNGGHVQDASLGYFLGPLISVALAVVVLKERLSRVQLAAVLLAAAAVLNLIVQLRVVPMAALFMGVSFSLYGLLRKRLAVGPVPGLFLECLLALPLALVVLAWLAADGSLVFPAPMATTNLLLLLGGAFTVGPLLCFNIGAKRVGLATIGLMQYIAPTMLFVESVLLFGEPLSRWRLVTFIVIWTALALYTADSLLRARRVAPGPLAPR